MQDNETPSKIDNLQHSNALDSMNNLENPIQANLLSDEKTLFEHIEDFRRLFLVWVIILAVSVSITLPFSSFLIEFTLKPLNGQQLYFQTPVDSIFFIIKIHLLVSFLIALPCLILSIWFYIRKALSKAERNYTLGFLVTCLVLFYTGIIYSYYILLPSSLKILLSFAPVNTSYILLATEYINFLIGVSLAFVAVFLLPVCMYICVKTGLIPRKFFVTYRKFAYFAIILLLAILTPTPDVFTLVLITAPILILYELVIILTRNSHRLKS